MPLDRKDLIKVQGGRAVIKVQGGRAVVGLCTECMVRYATEGAD